MTTITTISSTTAAIKLVKMALACSFVTFLPQSVRLAMLSHQLVLAIPSGCAS